MGRSQQVCETWMFTWDTTTTLKRVKMEGTWKQMTISVPGLQWDGSNHNYKGWSCLVNLEKGSMKPAGISPSLLLELLVVIKPEVKWAIKGSNAVWHSCNPPGWRWMGTSDWVNWELSSVARWAGQLLGHDGDVPQGTPEDPECLLSECCSSPKCALQWTWINYLPVYGCSEAGENLQMWLLIISSESMIVAKWVDIFILSSRPTNLETNFSCRRIDNCN